MRVCVRAHAYVGLLSMVEALLGSPTVRGRPGGTPSGVKGPQWSVDADF